MKAQQLLEYLLSGPNILVQGDYNRPLAARTLGVSLDDIRAAEVELLRTGQAYRMPISGGRVALQLRRPRGSMLPPDPPHKTEGETYYGGGRQPADAQRPGVASTAGSYKTYVIRENGKDIYVGMTGQDLDKRMEQHWTGDLDVDEHMRDAAALGAQFTIAPVHTNLSNESEARHKESELITAGRVSGKLYNRT